MRLDIHCGSVRMCHILLSLLLVQVQGKSMNVCSFALRFTISYCFTFSVYGGVAEGRPVTVRQRRLPCCGIGLGWFL